MKRYNLIILSAGRTVRPKGAGRKQPFIPGVKRSPKLIAR
jgi:hypothetical protein